MGDSRGSIVDSKPFQRLRRIKQLGMADLVYPCAKHTRFDHSLGTLSAAQLMVDNLKKQEIEIDDDDIDCIRCYALLHDISHIPFGHTLEDEGKLYKRHDKGKRWEYYTKWKFPQTDYSPNTLEDIISPPLFDKMSKLVKEKFDKDNKFIYDLVSNTICADLIDYIQRDGYFTGATSLRFKFDDRILRFMTLGEDKEGRRSLIFKPKKDKIRIDVITDLIQLLRYRYMITERVTFHHTRSTVNAMLIKAIQLLGRPEEEMFYWMGDEDVLNYISRSDDKNIKELGEMLKSRNLFKIVFRVTSYTAPELQEGSVKDVSNKYGKPEGRMELENKLINEITKISGLNHFNKNHIAIYCPPDENMNFKETRVLVQWRGEYPTPLTDIVPVHTWEYLIKNEVKALEDKYKALWNMHIFVHPKYSKNSYQIEKCCERVLGVKNDPLLLNSLGRREDYKELHEIEQMLSSKATEIVTTTRQIEQRVISARESPSAAGIETSREDALKEAILHHASPVKKEEDDDDELKGEKEDDELKILRGKKKSNRK